MTSDTIEIGIISLAGVAASELVLGGAGNGIKGEKGEMGPVFRKLREEEVAEFVFSLLFVSNSTQMLMVLRVVIYSSDRPLRRGGCCITEMYFEEFYNNPSSFAPVHYTPFHSIDRLERDTIESDDELGESIARFDVISQNHHSPSSLRFSSTQISGIERSLDPT